MQQVEIRPALCGSGNHGQAVLIHAVRPCSTGQIGFGVEIEHIIGAISVSAAVDTDKAFQIKCQHGLFACLTNSVLCGGFMQHWATVFGDGYIAVVGAKPSFCANRSAIGRLVPSANTEMVIS